MDTNPPPSGVITPAATEGETSKDPNQPFKENPYTYLPADHPIVQASM